MVTVTAGEVDERVLSLIREVFSPAHLEALGRIARRIVEDSGYGTLRIEIADHKVKEVAGEERVRFD